MWYIMSSYIAVILKKYIYWSIVSWTKHANSSYNYYFDFLKLNINIPKRNAKRRNKDFNIPIRRKKDFFFSRI